MGLGRKILIAAGKIVLLAIMFMALAVAGGFIAMVAYGPSTADVETPTSFLAQGIVQFTAALLMALVLLGALDRLAPSAIGLVPRHVTSDLTSGFLVGVLSFVAVVGLAVLFGAAHYAPKLEQFSWSILGLMGLAIVFFAATEEILVRGYVLRELRSKFSFATAMLVSSLLFAAAHAPTLLVAPHGIVGVLNVTLAGIWFALAFWRSGALWLPIGLHTGWNFAEGPLLGSTLSGHDANKYWSLFDWHGDDWLTGGNFGPEASLLATLGVLAGIAVVLMLPQRGQPPATAS